MSHRPSGMPRVQRPTERFGGLIGGVNNSRDVMHNDVATSTPLLQRKVLYVDVTRAGRGLAFIDHRNSSQELEQTGENRIQQGQTEGISRALRLYRQQQIPPR